jgi:hypothetical protein
MQPVRGQCRAQYPVERTMSIQEVKRCASTLALALGIASAPRAAGVEPKEPASLQLKPKSAIAISAPSRNYAPFVVAAFPAPELDLLPHSDLRQVPSRSSCDSVGVLCCDPATGRLGLRAARNLMPDLPGLTRENISLNRHWIVLRYSF